jgi:double-stranded uracil-DNA glycosylase
LLPCCHAGPTTFPSSLDIAVVDIAFVETTLVEIILVDITPAGSNPAGIAVGGSVRNQILPDVLGPDLRVVFCGTAASNVSAKAQAYYAHPRNKFWTILSETGLTSSQLKPDEFMLMPRFGYGLTDVCKQASGTDSQIPRVTSMQRAELHEKILRYQPAFLAFTSLEAGRRYGGQRMTLGAQEARIGRSRVWILPSTSPNAAWNWNTTKHHWHEFAEHVATAAPSAADA